jgi:hypothetical protein
MKGAFDANLPRTKPLTRQNAKTIEQPALGAPQPEKDIAALAHSGLPLDAEFDPDAAAQKLIAHIKSRTRKEHNKARSPSQPTAATPLAGQVFVQPSRQGDEAPPPTNSSRAAVETLLTEQTKAPAPKPAADAAALRPAMVRDPQPAERPATMQRSAPASTTTVSLPGSEVLTQGRARIEQFRERLHASSRTGSAQASTEPWATAEATRQAVDSFRARVSSVSRERDALNEALQLVRAELDQSKKELATKNQALAAAEALANERIQLANTLLSEVEVLADERDQALVRISELKLLDEQQVRLLTEAETALTQRDEQLVSMQKKEAELQAVIHTRADELERLTARLAERTAERDLMMDRIARLESEVRALSDSRGALMEIKRLLDSAKV